MLQVEKVGPSAMAEGLAHFHRLIGDLESVHLTEAASFKIF